MSKEFENNGLFDPRTPPKERAKEIAMIWGEGYKPLINLLDFCIRNEIKTLACCAGHGTEYYVPYILFREQGEISNYIVEKMVQEKSVESIMFSRHPELKEAIFSFFCEYKDREEFFLKITRIFTRIY